MIADWLWGLVFASPRPKHLLRRALARVGLEDLLSTDVDKIAAEVEGIMARVRAASATTQALKLPPRPRQVQFRYIEAELPHGGEAEAIAAANTLADRFKCGVELWWAGNDGEGDVKYAGPRKGEEYGKVKAKPRGKIRGKAKSGGGTGPR